jgi:hypothetical protein
MSRRLRGRMKTMTHPEIFHGSGEGDSQGRDLARGLLEQVV